MNNGVAFALGFIAGSCGIGFAVNKILKQKYEQRSDEEIAACRNAFLDELGKRRKEEAEKETKEKEEAAVEAIKTYSPEPEKAEKDMKANIKNPKTKPPYIIEPTIYDSPENPYKIVGLRYYNDGTIADDHGKVLSLEELDELVGREALTHFGEHEEDRVCVRNEASGTDYEICMIDKKYEEVRSSDPGK